MSNELFDNRVHLLAGVFGHAVIGTACGARMQSGEDGWDNEVNYWGGVGVRQERPFTTVTLDPSKVTCKRKGCRSEENE